MKKTSTKRFMSILVVNVGSSTCKYKVFEEPSLRLLQEGGTSFLETGKTETAIKQVLRSIGNIADIRMTAHRIVHGGVNPKQTQALSAAVIHELEQWNFLAPLHNPRALTVAKLFLEYVPGIKHVAVYDSGFFQSLPLVARAYALPKALSAQYGIERIGFHGISHEYACHEAARQLKKPFKKATLISFHLGGGSSVCVVSKGEPLDVSMGFTPLEGLPMMTRSGDVDPGVLLYLMKKGYTADSLEKLLNEDSGLKGLSGKSEFLDILRERQFNEDARFAFDLFVYRLRKYLGSYLAVTPTKPDAIIFTGEIGAGDPALRKTVVKDLWVAKGIPIVVVPPKEELAMARKVIQRV